jgi:antiviral defense system Shedu protein SduA
MNASAVADYLREYAREYRAEYRRLTTSPPAGAGYPQLVVSPYLLAGEIDCLLSPDGAVLYDTGHEPEYEWWVAGGPALMVDYAESKTPEWVVNALKKLGIWGKAIGIYRIVSKGALPAEVWAGNVDSIVDSAQSNFEGVEFRVCQTSLLRLDVLRRLTFGAVGILDLHLPGIESQFWFPHVIRRLGFCTADRQHRRFFNYLEIIHHVDPAAWDKRSIATRVQVDVRRDFGWAFGAAGNDEAGGSISFGHGQSWVQPFFDRLTILNNTLQEFSSLIVNQRGAVESVFHEFLQKNPILLDVYAEATSKPRWYYPAGDSPLQKEYVEPDFVLRYSDGSYRLVELERPSKLLATGQGQPRAEVNQAAFQIAEWRAYIANHYELIKKHFPGIAIRQSATIVISSSSTQSYGERRDPKKYKELLATQYPGLDILTYDELLDRTRAAYTRLASLAIASP